jgi:hypothetical protein
MLTFHLLFFSIALRGKVQGWFFHRGGLDDILEREYSTQYGRPLIDRIPSSSQKESPVDILRHRQELLEKMLGEYFIDKGFLKNLRSTPAPGVEVPSLNIGDIHPA